MHERTCVTVTVILESAGNRRLPGFFSIVRLRFTVSSPRCATLHKAVTYIYELKLLRCPYVRARQYLHDACLLPTTARSTFSAGTAEKNFIVRYERGKDPLRFHEPWNVMWEPEDGGPHPGFVGQLTLHAHESYRAAILELHGTCGAPLQCSNRSVDVMLAAKIASATARALLTRIGERLEYRYLQDDTDREQAAG